MSVILIPTGIYNHLPQALDVPEQTPKNLYLTAALLIREGFITLEDIYPHVCTFATTSFHTRLD